MNSIETSYDIVEMVNKLKGVTIVTYGMDNYESQELKKIFNYINITVIPINNLKETINIKYDAIILNTNFYSLFKIICDIKENEIDNKKLILIKYDSHIDYEVVDLFEWHTVEYPINYIDFIKSLYSTIIC